MDHGLGAWLSGTAHVYHVTLWDPPLTCMHTPKTVQTLGYNEQPVYGVHLVTGLQEGLVKYHLSQGFRNSFSLDSFFLLVVVVGRIFFVAQAGPKQFSLGVCHCAWQTLTLKSNSRCLKKEVTTKSTPTFCFNK